MTGYGEAQAPVAMASGLSVHVDLRGVNGRFLDVSFRLPDELRASETALRAMLSGATQRPRDPA